MDFKSKKVYLLILGITSIICSRALLGAFNDPEGPNLLIVTVLAAIIYFLSLTIYFFKFFATWKHKLWWGILIQIAVIVVLYFCLS